MQSGNDFTIGVDGGPTQMTSGRPDFSATALAAAGSPCQSCTTGTLGGGGGVTTGGLILLAASRLLASASAVVALTRAFSLAAIYAPSAAVAALADAGH